MASSHLTNDEFFTRLTDLFEYNRKKGHGSVYLTQKRLSFDSDDGAPSPKEILDNPLWDHDPKQPLPVLIRASNNKSTKRKGKDRPGSEREDIDRIRLSTAVQPDQLDAFYVRYAEACRTGMGGLKKRDRTKKKKDKKKKKGAVETKG